MINRFSGSLIAAVACATLTWTPRPAAAQPPARGRATASKPGPVPRMPDGKPDFSGFWSLASLRFDGNLAQGKESEVPYTPLGQAAYKNHDAKDDPTGKCLPPGMPRILHSPFPMQIMQDHDHLAMLFEYQRIWRMIYVDGTPHHQDVDGTFMGDSIGKWEGDTLVIDTVGLNDRTWLDTAGHQHSADLHVIERLARTGPETIAYEVTIDDPKMYAKPWTHTGTLTPQRATKGLPELLEYFCNDNNVDVEHLTVPTKTGVQ